eukprot:Tamp_06739.p1 GENE.Tamp_06739~~Tamp_06739.p1  ORF type:complete len:776 (-),score=131.94 Tamp_06739:318-2567(-)
MTRTRKYAGPGAGEGPDGLRTPAAKPAADAGHHTSPHCKGEHAPMETTPKGKGSMASTNKTTPSLLRPAHGCAPSPSKMPRSGKGSSAQASASGAARGSPGAKVAQAGKRAAQAQQPAGGSGSDGRGSRASEVDPSGTRVFTFGTFFFQDEGPAVSFDAVAASVWSASPARRRPENSVQDDAAMGDGRAASAGKWVVHETHPYLLTRLDGKKRWFHCSKCEYRNDRLYHTKMHYERIHVNQGRSMPRKRKYADPGAGEGPDGLRTPAAKPAADAGHHTSPHCKGEHAPMETTPKGKGSMASTNKTTPSLLRPAHGCAPSPSKMPRSGKGSSAQASASGAARGSPGAKVAQAGKRAAQAQQPAGGSGSDGRGSRASEVDPSGTRVFTFGTFFFQDEGPAVSFDVADMCTDMMARPLVLGPGAQARAHAQAKAPRAHACHVSPRAKCFARPSGAAGKKATVAQGKAGRGAKGLVKIEDGVHHAGSSSSSLHSGASASSLHSSASASLHGRCAGSTASPALQHPPSPSPSFARSPMRGVDWRQRRAEEPGGARSLSDASPGPSPHRPTTLLMGPVTPVTNRTGFFSAERSPALMQSFLRSPALGDGMQALRSTHDGHGMQALRSTHDGLPGLAPGSLLSGCSVSERRQASLMFSGCLSGSSVPSVGMSGFLSAPDSCARSVREMSCDAVASHHSRRGSMREGSSELLNALAGLSKTSGGGNGGSAPLMGLMGLDTSDNLLFCGESLDPFAPH